MKKMSSKNAWLLTLGFACAITLVGGLGCGIQNIGFPDDESAASSGGGDFNNAAGGNNAAQNNNAGGTVNSSGPNNANNVNNANNGGMNNGSDNNDNNVANNSTVPDCVMACELLLDAPCEAAITLFGADADCAALCEQWESIGEEENTAALCVAGSYDACETLESCFGPDACVEGCEALATCGYMPVEEARWTCVADCAANGPSCEVEAGAIEGACQDIDDCSSTDTACHAFCEAEARDCAELMFMDRAECLVECDGWPHTDEVAPTSASVECYSAIADAIAREEETCEALEAGCAGPTAECTQLCDAAAANCQGEDAAFADDAACFSFCATLELGVDGVTGDTIRCRMEQATLAEGDPEVICPDVGASSAVCVDVEE